MALQDTISEDVDVRLPSVSLVTYFVRRACTGKWHPYVCIAGREICEYLTMTNDNESAVTNHDF